MPVSIFLLGLQNLAADEHICHAKNCSNQKYRQHNAENGHPALLPVDLYRYGNKVKIMLHSFFLPNPSKRHRILGTPDQRMLSNFYCG